LGVLKRIMLLLMVLSIIGCAGIPLSSVYKMMTTNPFEFHPDAISIAVKRSNVIQVQTGDVELKFSIHSDKLDLKVLQQYFLVVDNTPRVTTITEELKNNEALTVLTLSTEDVIRMKNLQKRMRDHLKKGGKSSDFGFSVRVLEGCKNTNDIPDNVFVSLFLKLDSRSDFFPLYEYFDIGQADLSPLKNLENWNDCNNHANKLDTHIKKINEDRQ